MTYSYPAKRLELPITVVLVSGRLGMNRHSVNAAGKGLAQLSLSRRILRWPVLRHKCSRALPALLSRFALFAASIPVLDRNLTPNRPEHALLNLPVPPRSQDRDGAARLTAVGIAF